MSAFLLTIFWLQVISAVFYVSYLTGSYPRKVESKSVGHDCVCLIINLTLLAWVSYLLWGTK